MSPTVWLVLIVLILVIGSIAYFRSRRWAHSRARGEIAATATLESTNPGDGDPTESADHDDTEYRDPGAQVLRESSEV